MVRFTVPAGVFLSSLLLGGLLAACSERRAAEPAVPPLPAGAASAASALSAAAAPASSSALVEYLRGAEIQAENEAQRDELKKALRDIRSMPAAELRAARYAGADGKPAQRDVVQVLRAHVVPAKPQGIALDQLLVDRESEAGRAALGDTLATLDRPASK